MCEGCAAGLALKIKFIKMMQWDPVPIFVPFMSECRGAVWKEMNQMIHFRLVNYTESHIFIMSGIVTWWYYIFNLKCNALKKSRKLSVMRLMESGIRNFSICLTHSWTQCAEPHKSRWCWSWFTLSSEIPHPLYSPPLSHSPHFSSLPSTFLISSPRWNSQSDFLLVPLNLLITLIFC